MQSYNHSCPSKITLYLWEIPADLLFVPVFAIQAYGVLLPHFSKASSAAQHSLDVLTDQAREAVQAV